MSLASFAEAVDFHLRFSLLGSLRIERDTQPVHFPTRKIALLLAYLVLHREPQPRERLAALFWGDSTDSQARHSLRHALAVIRKELGDDVILTQRDTLQLNPGCSCWADVVQLRLVSTRIRIRLLICIGVIS